MTGMIANLKEFGFSAPPESDEEMARQEQVIGKAERFIASARELYSRSVPGRDVPFTAVLTEKDELYGYCETESGALEKVISEMRSKDDVTVTYVTCLLGREGFCFSSGAFREALFSLDEKNRRAKFICVSLSCFEMFSQK